jgi:hypothetical protein
LGNSWLFILIIGRGLRVRRRVELPLQIQAATQGAISLSHQLSKYERADNSQHGEDGIIEEISRRLGIEAGYFVEFGAMDGKAFSNTYRLAEKAGWSGCYIEANPQYIPALRKNLEGYDVACLERRVEVSGPDSLDNILQEATAPREFDVLSIDVNGDDYSIWEGLKDFTPKIVIVEFNPTIPNSYHFVQKPGDNIGCSAGALAKLGKDKGYALVAATFANLIFLHRNYLEKADLQDLDVEDCRPEIGAIFYAFDGRVIAEGRLKGSPWSGRTLYQEVNDMRPTFRDVRRLFRHWIKGTGQPPVQRR